MLSYEEALGRILADVTALPSERVALASAAGRILAEPVAARFDQPPFDASAMDGYAIRWDDMPGPWRVVGESGAGAPYDGKIERGEAVRIFTGAPLPEGADTVLVQEDTERVDADLHLTGDGPPKCTAHVRSRGNDFTAAEQLIEAGTRLSAAALGLAAAAGHGDVAVHRRPRVALISNGDELVPPGRTPGPAQIVASSGPMLSAQLAAAGAEVEDFGIIPDDEGALTAALERAKAFDLVLTVGGASVGAHDLVKPALEAAGAEIDFWRIAIRPGKPLIHGRLGSAAFIGLPGNPVSAYICTQLFAMPLLFAVQGHQTTQSIVEARLTEALPSNDRRRDHLRAVMRGGEVAPLPTQDSAQLAVLARANALIIREPYAEPAKAGDPVRVLPLDRT